MMRAFGRWISCLCVLALVIPSVFASRVKSRPLEERVRAAETVFVGKVVNKVVEGDWARAELLVVEPLANAKKDAKIEVVWRVSVGGQPIYDANEGAVGIAILKDKHKGRYWLRGDKFEDLKNLAKVRKVVAEADA